MKIQNYSFPLKSVNLFHHYFTPLPDNVDSNTVPFKSQAPDGNVHTRKARALPYTHVLVDLPTDASLTRVSAVAPPALGFLL